MKLTNLNEAYLSSPTLTKKDEIEEYITETLRYQGKYTLDENMHVTFLQKLKLTQNSDVRQLKSKIKKCKTELVLDASRLCSLINFPDKCQTLDVMNNVYLEDEIHVKTIADNTYFSDNNYIKSLITDDKQIRVFSNNSQDISRMKLNKIRFNNDSSDIGLMLQGCLNITSFNDIIIPSKTLYFMAIKISGIKSFKEYDFNIGKYAEFKLEKLRNFLYIDKVFCKEILQVEVYDVYDNIITLLLNRTPEIKLRHAIKVDDDRVISILNKYIKNNNRWDYVMDCAVELLEHNGFEKAAEL